MGQRSRARRGFGRTQGGGGSANLGHGLNACILRNGKSEIGELVKAVYFNVRWDDAQVVPPPRSRGLPRKENLGLSPCGSTAQKYSFKARMYMWGGNGQI